MSYTRINNGFFISSKLIDNTNNQIYDLSDYIIDVMVRQRFLDDSFPLFVIDLKTTEEIRNIMRDNTIQIYLRISSYFIDDADRNTDVIDANEINESSVVFDGLIRIYEQPFTTSTIKNEEENTDGTNSESAVNTFYYRVSGIPEDCISKNEVIINRIFKEANLTDSLISLFNEIPNIKSLKISPEFDNKFVYSNILIPPLNLVPAIDFLDTNYKFYSTGYNLFINNSTCYLYSPLSQNLEYENILECNVLNLDATADTENNGKIFVDENNNLKTTYRNLPTFSSEEKIVSHSIGNNSVYYTYDDNFDLITRATGLSSSYKKSRYIWNENERKIFEDENTNLHKLNSSMILAYSNLDPTYFTPLTKIKVISAEYPEATGEYCISEVSYMMSSTDKKHFSNTISITALKK